MDQNNNATPDELQQTINSITNPGGAAPAADVVPAPAAPEIPPIEVAQPPIASGKAVYGDPDLDRVKSMALSDLRPIIESVDIEPAKKFKIYKEIIDLTEDKACIEPAYNAAKNIDEQKAKAEALLYIVEAIDKLGIPVANVDGQIQ